MAKKRHPLQHGKQAARAGRALGVHRAKSIHSTSVAAVRREYCASRSRTDALGRHLGMLTGVHKKRAKHKKRHVVCRTSR